MCYVLSYESIWEEHFDDSIHAVSRIEAKC